MIRTGLFRYVAHGKVFEMMAAGWMLAGDLGPTHGKWSALMWRCDCLGDDDV